MTVNIVWFTSLRFGIDLVRSIRRCTREGSCFFLAALNFFCILTIITHADSKERASGIQSVRSFRHRLELGRNQKLTGGARENQRQLELAEMIVSKMSVK